MDNRGHNIRWLSSSLILATLLIVSTVGEVEKNAYLSLARIFEPKAGNHDRTITKQFSLAGQRLNEVVFCES